MSDARTVYVYEVEPCQADARGTSGWTITVATEHLDFSDLPRIVRVAIAEKGEREGFSEDWAPSWTGIKRAWLVTTAVLDPRIA